MKKLVCLAIAVGLVGVTAQASAKVDPAAAEKKAEQKKLVEARKAELNGSEWKVKMTSSDPAIKPEDDLLTFQNTQVRSKVLSDRSFVPTNYTVTVEPGNDWAVWETMQTSAKEGVVFIRGEWLKDEMRGVISQQLEGGKTRDYNFTTVGKIAVPPTTPKPEKKPEPKPEPAKAEEPKAEEALPSDKADDALSTAAQETAPAVEKAVVEEAPASVQAELPKPVEKKKKRWGF